MMRILKILKNLLIYKEPIDPEGFEFVESSDGKVPSAEPSVELTKKEKTKKTPLSIEDWNREKNPDKQGAISTDLNINLSKIKEEFLVPKNADVVIREFKIGRKVDAFIVFVDGMADKATVNDFVLRELMEPEHFKNGFQGSIIDYILENVLSINQVNRVKEYENVVQEVLSGITALFIKGCSESILIESRGFDKRGVEKPSVESVVNGPQEGFTEDLRTNITLIRRILKNRKLVTEITKVGKKNNTNIAIMYLEDVVNPTIVEEVKKRIKSLDIDLVIEGGMLVQLIEDNPLVFFPQVLSTERPDRTVSLVAEGRVAIIVDGSPFVNIVPTTFFEQFHTSEDAYLSWYFGSFIRVIRLFGIFVSALLPGFYIALTTFHQEMLPTDLLITFALSRENVPFPVIVETLIMEISFELIREAGIRVPGVIGPALGIIGAIILGQAAVAANIVSPILIIVIAVTGLGSFSLPNYSFSFSMRIVRFFFIFFGAISGYFGISAAIIILGGIACSIKSFGVPYFAPIAPKTKSGPDILLRGPLWLQKERPDYLNPLDKKRMGETPRGWTKEKEEGDK
ncbi:MAG TPA: spore germination protein [Thermoanaerobacterales bacterium]|nr:spore germination protein [Thermoanaerobacterales bacterium]